MKGFCRLCLPLQKPSWWAASGSIGSVHWFLGHTLREALLQASREYDTASPSVGVLLQGREERTPEEDCLVTGYWEEHQPGTTRMSADIGCDICCNLFATCEEVFTCTHTEAHRQTQTGKQTDRQTDRPTDQQTDRPTDRQTDSQTDRQTHRRTHTHTQKKKKTKPTHMQTHTHTHLARTNMHGAASARPTPQRLGSMLWQQG